MGHDPSSSVHMRPPEPDPLPGRHKWMAHKRKNHERIYLEQNELGQFSDWKRRMRDRICKREVFSVLNERLAQ